MITKPNRDTLDHILAVRLPTDVYLALVRRMLRTNYQSLSDYVRHRLVYDTRRSHHKVKQTTQKR